MFSIWNANWHPSVESEGDLAQDTLKKIEHFPFTPYKEQPLGVRLKGYSFSSIGFYFTTSLKITSKNCPLPGITKTMLQGRKVELVSGHEVLEGIPVILEL